MENKLLNNYLNKKDYKYLKCFITKVLMCLIILFGSLIYVKYSDNNLINFQKYVFDNNFDFMKFKNIYNKYLGTFIKDNNTSLVLSENIFYEEKENYLNGYIYYTNNNVINSISSGIVVYAGKKDNLDNTIIIQSSDGYDILYGYLDNINVNLYDYVNTSDILGNSMDKLYLQISKDDSYYTYEEYIQNKNQ